MLWSDFLNQVIHDNPVTVTLSPNEATSLVLIVASFIYEIDDYSDNRDDVDSLIDSISSKLMTGD